MPSDDVLDAFAYSIEALKYQRARREKLHKLRLILLAMAAVIIGSWIGWLIS